MGVRELLKLLKNKVKPQVLYLHDVVEDFRAKWAAVSESENSSPSSPSRPKQMQSPVLLVDFQAFSFWILESFEDEISSWDFQTVSTLAWNFVEQLRHHGVEVILVDDGARGSSGKEEMEAKLEEWQKRAEEQVRDVRKLKEYLDKTGMERPKKLQRVSLFTMALRHGLHKAHAELRLREGEADPILAAELIDHRTIGILGNDTDFVLMKHGKFCHLDNLDKTRWLPKEWPTQKCQLKLPLWTRQQLATTLEVSEQVLPMAAVLCGNDHSRRLIDTCRSRGLKGKDGHVLSDQFEDLAKLLQQALDAGKDPEDAALDLLTPALYTHEEYGWATKVILAVQCFYAPQREKNVAETDPKMHKVREDVRSGKLPKWCWPLAAHGIYFAQRVLDDPGLGSCASGLLMHLKTPAFSILAPLCSGAKTSAVSKVQVRILGSASETESFQDTVKLWNNEGDVYMYLKKTPEERLQWLHRKIEGDSVANHKWEFGKAMTLRELHLFSLRFTLRFAKKLKLTEMELESLMFTAWCLSTEGFEKMLAVGVDTPSFRCLCLGAWYQEVIVSILDLCKLLHVSPTPLLAEQLFDGKRFLQIFHYFSQNALQRKRYRGKMCGGDRKSPGDAEIEKLSSSDAYWAWREEVTFGFNLEDLRSSDRSAWNEGTFEVPLHGPGLGPSSVPHPVGNRLPIEEHKETLCNALLENRVVCVRGETGSGKSTQVPQYILELFPSARIAVTQPRRMAAVNLAKRVAKERHEELGECVGYRIGGDSVPGKRLNFQTTGWLLRALVSDTSRLEKLTHVVFDEIHERSADADFLSLVVRLLLHRCPEVKLVIMSATLQADLFSVYFQELQFAQAKVPLVEVGGKCYEVRKVFLDDIKDFCKEGLSSQGRSLVWRLCQKFQDQKMEKKNSQALMDFASTCTPLIIDLLAFLAKSATTILVFLPGLQEITDIYDECQRILHAADGAVPDNDDADDAENPAEAEGQRRNFKMKFKVFAMHSQIPMEDQMAVFQTPAEDVCHFVLASNVAESSLTLPNVSAVVDLGMNKQQVYDHRMKMTYLALKWTSKASAHQRSGRAGRTMEGTVVRLYPRSFYETHLPDFDRPETAVLPLPRLYLQAKQLAKDLAQMAENEDDEAVVSTACSVLTGLVDPPDLSIVEASRRELAEGYALEAPEETAEMTAIGRACLSLPFDLSLSRLVWFGIHWGCAVDGVILACSLAVQDPFSSPSSFAFPDLSDLGPRLYRSNWSRQYFDKGMKSQPLALLELFKEFWQTFPLDPARDGRKGWLKHAHTMVRDYAVIPRRLTELVAQVDEVAQRLVSIVKKDSEAQRRLARLLAGLGRRTLDTLGTEFTDDANYQGPTPWDEAEKLTVHDFFVESKEEKAKRIMNRKKMIGKVFEEDTDMLRALLTASFSDRLLTSSRKHSEMKKNAKLFRAMTELAGHQRADLRRCILLKIPEKLPPEISVAHLVTLMLANPQRNYKHLGIIDEHECIQIQGEDTLSEAWSTSGLMPSDLDADLHVLNQLTRGKPNGQCQLDLKKLQLARDETGSSVVPLTVVKPVHPCQLTWEVHASVEEDQKGRQSKMRRGIPEGHSAIGFVCGLPESPPQEDRENERDNLAILAEQLSQMEQVWYGCCSQVQYTEGIICFISGLTVLHPKHLKFFLLTVDPIQTNLALRLSDGLSLEGLRLHGKEIAMNVSRKEMTFIDRFRENLRASMVDGSSLCESDMLNELRAFCDVSLNEGPPIGAKIKSGGWMAAREKSDKPSLAGMQPLMQRNSDAKMDVLTQTVKMMNRKKKRTSTKAVWKLLCTEHLWKEDEEASMVNMLLKHPDVFVQKDKQWKLA